MARPTKLNTATVAALDRALKAGATYEIACMAAGISYSTYRSWVVKAETVEKRLQAHPEDEATPEEQGYLEFLEAVKKAEGETALRNLAIISMAAQGRRSKDGEQLSDPVWTAAAWLLERRYPHMYGRQVQEIKSDSTVTVAHIPPAAIAELDKQIDQELERFERDELGSDVEWDRPMSEEPEEGE